MCRLFSRPNGSTAFAPCAVSLREIIGCLQRFGVVSRQAQQTDPNVAVHRLERPDRSFRLLGEPEKMPLATVRQ